MFNLANGIISGTPELANIVNTAEGKHELSSLLNQFMGNGAQAAHQFRYNHRDLIT